MGDTCGVMDDESMYRALESRDPRFDGRVWFGVTSTGVYCRPVCPAQTPKRGNVRFFSAPAAAVSAGFRACKRCRPDAAPGSRRWDERGDLAARALRLIGDGIVDEGGVAGLATRLHVSERHLHRTLVAEVGAGPLDLAVSRRAQTARMLVDQTTLSLTDVAFASGFASIRQFNDVMRREFGMAPSELRRSTTRSPAADSPGLALRLRVRRPFDSDALGAFLAARAVPGLERHHAGTPWRHERLVPLPSGAAHIVIEPADDHVMLRTRSAALADTARLVNRVRRWLDLDASPELVADALMADSALTATISARPGLRVPTTVDRWETCLRAILGQQVTLAGGVTLFGRLVASHRSDLDPEHDGLALAPSAATIAAIDPDVLAATVGMPRSRGRSLHSLAAAVAAGTIDLSGDRDATLDAILALPGIGPWTRDYLALRAFGDPDAFPVTDIGIRRGASSIGLPDDPRALAERSQRWRPWRAYAAQHLWTVTPTENTKATRTKEKE